MDKAPANSRRVHFLLTGTTTPQLIVGAGNRHALVLVNESSTLPIHIGHSGTVKTIGLYIGSSQSFADNYTSDDYWLVGSGTLVSGFVAL
jgi:hypothetical protein